jgi:tetratricopeptide (TPR) repeat protein
MKTRAISLFVVTTLLTASALAQGDKLLKSRDELNMGVQAYKNGKYAEAVQHFKEALSLDPSNQNAQLYLATAYYIQWVPGVDSPENAVNHDLAKQQFEAALEKDAKNDLALSMMASMAYNLATTAGKPEQKVDALDEAKKWNERRIEANPKIAEPYCYLGVISWAEVYTPIMKARVEAGMPRTAHGPIENPEIRKPLRDKYWETIQDGLDNLQKCLEIDKENQDAMTYTNLLFRVRAALEESTATADDDVAQAESWADKAIETKKNKAKTPSDRQE